MTDHRVEINIGTPTSTYNCVTRDFHTMPTRWEIFESGKVICTFTWTDNNYGLEDANPLISIPDKEVERIQHGLELRIEALKKNKQFQEPEPPSQLELTQEAISMLRAPAEEDLISLHEVLAQMLQNQAFIMIELLSMRKLTERIQNVMNIN